MPELNLDARLTNIAELLFFMFMMSAICRAAFYGFNPLQILRAFQPRELSTVNIEVPIREEVTTQVGGK